MKFKIKPTHKGPKLTQPSIGSSSMVAELWHLDQDNKLLTLIAKIVSKGPMNVLGRFWHSIGASKSLQAR